MLTSPTANKCVCPEGVSGPTCEVAASVRGNVLLSGKFDDLIGDQADAFESALRAQIAATAGIGGQDSRIKDIVLEGKLRTISAS